MSNFTSILAAAYLDQLSETLPANGYSNEVFMLQGSMQNPLRAMSLQTMDFAVGLSYDAHTLATAIGVPAEWLEADRLTAPMDEVITAVGKLALIVLSCQRNDVLKHGYDSDAAEDALQAVGTLAEVLDMNRKLMAH